MYTGIDLNVSQESYLFELFDLSFDLKSVLWQILCCILVATCALVICLICMPLALGLWAYHSATNNYYRYILIHNFICDMIEAWRVQRSLLVSPWIAY